MDFRPFRGLRPSRELVSRVACPPYDVIDSDEARQRVVGNPYSFLHVTKPEVDLPPETDPYSDVIYETAASTFRRFLDDGVFREDPKPRFYAYRQQMGEHTQMGLVGVASVDEYDQDLIKKHEHTRRDKEDDRARHVDTVGANAGPVFLTYRADRAIDAVLAAAAVGAPDADIEADGVRHTLWVLRDPSIVRTLQNAFGAVPAFYVADGHHRAASASRTRALRRGRNPSHTGDEAYNRFLCVVLPDDQLRILPYNRVVRDLAGLTVEAFVERVTEKFDVAKASDAAPTEPRTFRMLLGGQWYSLTAREGTFPATDPVRSLDVAILQDNLLGSVLGIGDPRTDKRIDFVGGIRGTGELERLVASGRYAVAFSMFPTTLCQLMGVADAGKVMPPKSTWFEPKLRSGLVVHLLDGEGP